MRGFAPSLRIGRVFLATAAFCPALSGVPFAQEPTDTDAAEPTGLGVGLFAWLCAAFLGALLVVSQPALEGPFVSDDFHYVRNNVYVHDLSPANLAMLFDPFGPAFVLQYGETVHVDLNDAGNLTRLLQAKRLFTQILKA